MRQTCLDSSEPMMLPDQTDACPDGGVECLQRPSTAGESSVWESHRRGAGKIEIRGEKIPDRINDMDFSWKQPVVETPMAVLRMEKRLRTGVRFHDEARLESLLEREQGRENDGR